MEYNLREISNLINKALTDNEFNDLLFYDFDDVPVTEGMDKAQKIRKLLEYVKTKKEIEKLLDIIKKINPAVYSEYEKKIGQSVIVPINSIEEEVKQCDILILAANPTNTVKLQLQKEAELIRKELQRTELGRKYRVKEVMEAYIEDLSQYILEYQPIILHFSGHGDAEGELIFHNRQGQSSVVNVEVLAKLLKAIRQERPIECVVLNACFSLEKSDAIADYVSCVIGMDGDVDDNSAITFAEKFYRGLGASQGYYRSFEQGRIAIELEQLPNYTAPHFITRDYSLLQSQNIQAIVSVPRNFSMLPENKLATLYPLWFGTNRKQVDPQDSSQGFSSERDHQLHYGICQVAVPKSHKIGSTGSSWWQRLLTQTDDCLKLDTDSLQILEEALFWSNIQQSLKEHEPDEQSALVFIHGFNVSFEDAALRAAQIGFDLQIPGIMAFYSWPSQGKLSRYTVDESTIEASESYITEFLINFVQQSGVEKLHIMAHSMGNRGLLRAMQRILTQVQTASSITFGQIILAAPDVDRDVFEKLAEAYPKLSERTTLYLSAKDKALATSGIIHQYPRAGFFPPSPIKIAGIDSIEVSNIDLTLLGHGYFGDARIVLEDIRDLLIYNSSPEQRRHRLQLAPSGDYWMIRG